MSRKRRGVTKNIGGGVKEMMVPTFFAHAPCFVAPKGLPFLLRGGVPQGSPRNPKQPGGTLGLSTAHPRNVPTPLKGIP